MAKIKQLIQQLSQSDYEAIYYSLLESNADKSAYLLQSMRNRQVDDDQVRDELEMNQNAYYTLRSRLFQKIEEFLLARMESPRSDLLQKVATIHETVFTKRKAIALATLKRLEKELLEHDLSNELIVIYKMLKKFTYGTDEYFNYSRAYNEHVAYMLSVDKSEELLVSYFRKFGNYYLSDSQSDIQQLEYLRNEMTNISQIYKSHRLFVYQSCLEIFHRIVIEKDIDPDDKYEPIEELIERLDQTFKAFKNDPVYFHLEMLVSYFKLLYFHNYKVFKKYEKFYEEINEKLESFLGCHNLYTFPYLILVIKLERAVRADQQILLNNENHTTLSLYEPDKEDPAGYTVYLVYRAACAYHALRYKESAEWLGQALELDAIKEHEYTHVEIRAALTLVLACIGEQKEFLHMLGSVQREVRQIGKHDCKDVFMFLKVVRSSYVGHEDLETRLQILYERYRDIKNKRFFSPLRFFLMDDKVVHHLLKKI